MLDKSPLASEGAYPKSVSCQATVDLLSVKTHPHRHTDRLTVHRHIHTLHRHTDTEPQWTSSSQSKHIHTSTQTLYRHCTDTQATVNLLSVKTHPPYLSKHTDTTQTHKHCTDSAHTVHRHSAQTHRHRATVNLLSKHIRHISEQTHRHYICRHINTAQTLQRSFLEEGI